MNTRYLQLTKIIDQVIAEFIRNGIFPYASQVMSKTLAHIGDHAIGAPTCAISNVKYGSITDPYKYNALFSTAVDDIKLLYDMIVDQIRRVVTDMDYQLTWRSRIKTSIKKLESDIRTISAQPPYIYREDFADLSNLYMQHTSAYINCMENIATFKEDNLATRRVYPSIKSVSHSGETSQISSIYNIFDDSLNSMFFIVHNASSEGKHSISVAAVFNEPITFNKALAVGFSPKDMSLSITFQTPDGSRVMDPKNCDSFNNASWYTESITATGFTMLMSKDKADYIGKEANPYTYIFGLQSLEFYNARYTDYAEIESRKIEFYDLANMHQGIINIQLQSTVNKAEGCNVSYYLCITNKDTPDGWMRVNPNENIKLHEPASMTYALSNVNKYDFASERAVSLYKLTGQAINVPKTAYNISLVRNFMWKILYYFYEVTDDDVNQYTDSNPIIDDFVQTRGDTSDIYIAFHTFGDAKVLPCVPGNKKRMVMYTTYITSLTNDVIELGQLPIYWTDSTKINVYLNDSQANYTIIKEDVKASPRKVGVTYQLNLVQGVNKLSIVTNDYLASDMVEFNTKLSDAGITLSNSKCDKYPLSQVSLYDLAYNTRRGDISRFALDYDGYILTTNSFLANYILTYDTINEIRKQYNLFYKIVMSRNKDASSINTPQIDNISIIVNDLEVKA